MSIFVGFPGVGKTTLSNGCHRFIDLESSNFKTISEHNEDWYKIYCKVAMYLSDSGFHVFVSSHDVVRKYLIDKSYNDLYYIVPSPDIKSDWLDRLKLRYTNSQLDKDYRAYKYMQEHYDDATVDMINDTKKDHGPKLIEISTIDYNLKKMVNDALYKFLDIRLTI